MTRERAKELAPIIVAIIDASGNTGEWHKFEVEE